MKRLLLSTLFFLAALAPLQAENFIKHIISKPTELGMLYFVLPDKAECREEGALKGGLFSEISEALAPAGYKGTVEGFGIPDRFMTQATRSEQQEICSLDTASIRSEILRLFKNS